MLTENERKRLFADAPSPFREATVQDPPLDADGWMLVVIDDEPGGVQVCPWMPRVEAFGAAVEVVEPSGGDAALVVESDEGNFWVVGWWPQT